MIGLEGGMHSALVLNRFDTNRANRPPSVLKACDSSRSAERSCHHKCYSKVDHIELRCLMRRVEDVSPLYFAQGIFAYFDGISIFGECDASHRHNGACSTWDTRVLEQLSFLDQQRDELEGDDEEEVGWRHVGGKEV